MFDALSTLPPAHRWRRQAFPVPIVLALIREEKAEGPDRFLLIRRVSQPYQGQWALVGGKWDFGETLPVAVTREVAEETALAADFVALRGVVSERVAAPDGEGGEPGEAAHFLLFVCEVTAVAGIAEEQEEGAVAWFSRAQIDALHGERRIIPTDYVMLRRFVAASAIPHVEAEMVNGRSGAEPLPPQLRRFHTVSGAG